jgi:hypothetical protein
MDAIQWTSLDALHKPNVPPGKLILIRNILFLFFVVLLVIMNRAPAAQPVPPTYPSSSKKAKDWYKLEVEIKKEEKEEKLEGDAALNS